MRMLAPEGAGVRAYLKSAGLFEALRAAGVEADDGGAADNSDAQTIMSIVRFSTEMEANALADDALEVLSETGIGAANLYPMISETYGELTANGVQHSESEVGAYGLIRFHDSSEIGRRFVCVVADGGIGIRRSLERNPEHRGKVSNDWEAIELALGELVTGTGSSHRGIGLFGVSEDMRLGGGSLLIHSCQGVLRLKENAESEAHAACLFPGTLASVAIHA